MTQAQTQPNVQQQADQQALADVSDWRGVAAEEDAERTAAEKSDQQSLDRLRGRSRKLLGSLIRPHKPMIILAVVLLLVQNFAGMAGPYLVKLGIDNGIPPLVKNQGATVIITVGVAFGLAVLIEYATKRGFLFLSGKIGQEIILDLRRRVYDHFQRLSVGFHEKYTSGRVISRMTSDMDAISELVSGGIDDLVLAVLSVVSISGILFWMDWQLALATLGSFPFLLALSIWFQRSSTRAYRSTREKVALVIVHFVESMGGIRAVQAFRRERRNEHIFEQVNDDYRVANLKAFRLIATYAPGIHLIGNVTTAVVLTYGGYRALHGQVDVGVLAAFLLYLRRFFAPMQELSQFYNSLQSATAALEKLSGVLDEEPSVPEAASPAELPKARGEITFSGVEFSYRPDRPVLHRLDLAIPAGQTVAVVGATGAGKTTIAKLVSRFYDPSLGTVSLDGHDMRTLGTTDLRRAVVMVTQENFLFAGTIADNIAFGRPEATRAEIEEAARAIGADAFISALPDGYDTQIQKRGGRLSAGQRQLVAFARAFLADPAVLILDEATSSLDIPSERAVQRALRTILADRTAIVIAHRLSTVEIADRVLVLDGGRIAEDGSPRDLISSGGRYADLHQQWADSLA
ncbi:ABC transporter ATP-binding protein [Longispora albida]|uniref:ABC transporter ATP-binding protein n=1 Tax=Longispora albida TaxID=203523 RepID=UPI00036B301A|nr:ABC transporter ATP-binding protein [Longispora albida]